MTADEQLAEILTSALSMVPGITAERVTPQTDTYSVASLIQVIVTEGTKNHKLKITIEHEGTTG